jgi:competence protein ComEA
VINPGVYKINRGSRIADALVTAGGLGVNADRDWVAQNPNRAEVITDGMKIFIPAQGEQAVVNTIDPPTGAVMGSLTKVVSINTATAEELETLPGICLAIAGRIIDYRTQKGGFKSVEELKMVSGIGDKLYAKIESLVEL